MATEFDKKREAKKRELVREWNSDPANSEKDYEEFCDWIMPKLSEFEKPLVPNVGFNPRS